MGNRSESAPAKVPSENGEAVLAGREAGRLGEGGADRAWNQERLTGAPFRLRSLKGSKWGSYGPSLITTRSTRNRRSLKGCESYTMEIYIFLNQRLSGPLSLEISFPLLTGSSVISLRIMLAAQPSVVPTPRTASLWACCALLLMPSWSALVPSMM